MPLVHSEIDFTTQDMNRNQRDEAMQAERHARVMQDIAAKCDMLRPFPELELEVCNEYLWIRGKTDPRLNPELHDILKNGIGAMWHSTKTKSYREEVFHNLAEQGMSNDEASALSLQFGVWYWKPADLIIRKARNMAMNSIRNKYGSVLVETEELRPE